MKVVFVNGSPNRKQGNTEIFIQQMRKGMQTESTVYYVKGCDNRALAKELLEYDICIFVMPLYVFAMPGIVMKLFEAMSAYEYTNRKIGFIVQQGFDESCHSDYLRMYFPNIAKKLQFDYMGTIIKGGAAGTRWMPEKANKKLFTQLQTFAADMERTSSFSKYWMDTFSKPYQLSKKTLRRNQLFVKLSLTKIMWNHMLKGNHAYGKRFDRPYLS